MSELRVDTITDELGTGSPDFPNGITVSNATFGAIDITGSTIESTPIGQVTPAAGDFTTLTASGDVNFDSGTLFVDASENRVGIGTTSPFTSIDVQRNANDTLTRINVSNANAGTSALTIVGLGNDANISAAGIRLASSTNTSVGGNVFNIYQGLASPMTFSTSATERMRIDSSGNVGIGTTSPGAKLQITGAAGADVLKLIRTNGGSAGFKALILDSVNDGNLNYAGVQFNTGGNYKGQIIQESSGNIYFDAAASLVLRPSGSLFCSQVFNVTVGGTNRDVFVDSTGVIGYVSSLRESKMQIQDLTNTSWLYKLKPVSFKYRRKDEDGNYTDEIDGDIQYGMIAEDVEAVNSDLCFYDKIDGEKKLRGIQYSKLVPALLKAIQELKAELDELKGSQ